MGQALYRKHRPKKLSEVVGQEHITSTLHNALQQGRISHAYLFTGPRGVGKTSVARILAHEINDLPYKDDSMHIDIIEIDAASNRRIDEIRELRDKVYVAPVSAKYKVYIIDEVHMLTREAFNALLKTLEEPPAHVVFILATTDAHKLPETIVSRTQRFNFRPVEKAKVVEHLQTIADQEKLQTDHDVLELLAEHGEGSFRDSISLLDQASGQGQVVELSAVQQLLGLVNASALEALLAALDGGNSAQLMQQLEQLYDQGYQATAIAKQLANLLRRGLKSGQSRLDYGSTLQLLDSLLSVPQAFEPERRLEIVLLQALPPEIKVRPAAVAPMETIVSEVIETVPVKSEPAVISGTATMDAAIWPEVLALLKQKHNTLYGVVRMAQPAFDDSGTLKLTFAFGFHQKRLADNANRQKLAAVIKELTGQDINIECQLDAKVKIDTPPVKAKASTDIKAISNIFGGVELLES